MGYKITLEKLSWIVLIPIIISLIYYPISDIFKTPSNKEFNPAPVRVGEVYFRLNCYAENNELITEDSQIICKISAMSEQRKYYIEDVIIQAVKIEDISKAIWGCFAKIYNVSNDSYSSEILCRNQFYRDVFTLGVPGTFKFKISEVSALSESGERIEYRPSEFYTKNMIVMSKNEAYSVRIAEKSYIVALIALILFVPALIFELRRFLME